MEDYERKYLLSLAHRYPTAQAVATEIINLQSILALPKGTEHFLTDIHGEWEQFGHVLRNGSGSVRRKIDEEFGNTLTIGDKKTLATLIYYPTEKLDIIRSGMSEEELADWYAITLHRLVQVTKRVSSKYTRSKVRKALPPDFAYVIEELITEKEEIQDKEAYYNEIIKAIISTGRAEPFIEALARLIQRLVVDHLHIIGDIYDRGPGPHIIMDALCEHHSCDVQWGNHDVLWMAAAAGHMAAIATVIRIAVRYGNLATIEEGYGINLVPLATFAMETYRNTDCSVFAVSGDEDGTRQEIALDPMLHKAISILQFKLEGQVIRRHEEFRMASRLLLDKIDYEKHTVTVDGISYPMTDTDFPTVDPLDPYRLTPEEEAVMSRLVSAFTGCEKLQRHVRFLYTNGSLYKVYNGNLLYHGCVPLDEDGSFARVPVAGESLYGKPLYDALERHARAGYYGDSEDERQFGQDILWYLWTGPGSPVYGRDKMTTFERYFIKDAQAHVERKNPYYRLLADELVVSRILEQFGIDSRTGHIINGHVPVEQSKGESPVKCGGKLLIIDGGFSKPYHAKTGIAGYTLVSNSHGMRLVSHEYFESVDAAIKQETDILSDSANVETYPRRMLVADTDNGKKLMEDIQDLKKLLAAYRDGEIAEH